MTCATLSTLSCLIEVRHIGGAKFQRNLSWNGSLVFLTVERSEQRNSVGTGIGHKSFAHHSIRGEFFTLSKGRRARGLVLSRILCQIIVVFLSNCDRRQLFSCVLRSRGTVMDEHSFSADLERG